MPAQKITRDAAQMMLDRIESISGRELSPEEREDIEAWQRGTALSQLTSFYGWEVAMDMLRSYAEDQLQKLVNTDPADRDNVIGYHAAAFAANKIFFCFLEDVKNYIARSQNVPAAVRSLSRTSAPPESVVG